MTGALSTYFPGLALGASSGDTLRMEFDAFTASAGLTLLDYTLAGRVITGLVDETTGLSICMARDVQGEISHGRRDIDLSMPWAVIPGTSSRYEGVHAQIVVLDTVTLDSHLTARGGRPVGSGFRFTGNAPRTRRHGQMWNRVLAAVETAAWGGLLDQPVLAASLTDLAVTTAVESFPHNWMDTRRTDRVPTTAALRRAVAVIDERAHEPITVAEIATASRLSVRALQAAFTSQLSTTPTAYLRRVRLSIAHAALLEGDPGNGDRVDAIAHAAGFTHVPRFAAAYRAEYGENPRDTLRR